MILELEWDGAFLQLILRTREIFAIGPKSEMQRSHRGTISRSRSDFFGCRKQRDSGISVANEDGNSIPLVFVEAFKAEDLGVPLGRAWDVPDGQCNMIESVNFKH